MSLPVLRVPSMSGKVYAICMGKKRNIAKEVIESGYIVEGYTISVCLPDEE